MGGLLFSAVQTQTLTEIIDSDCLAADDACACLGHLASRIIWDGLFFDRCPFDSNQRSDFQEAYGTAASYEART